MPYHIWVALAVAGIVGSPRALRVTLSQPAEGAATAR